MSNRRNHYRTLQLQPDASPTLIKAAYRTLMQTLRHHPDLGGDHATASAINQAYQTLRNPRKRAEYDRQQADCIADISRGGLPRFRRGNHHTDEIINRRNHYRNLGIQPDADDAIIETAWQTQRHSIATAIYESYQLLRVQHKRQQYDHLLRRFHHRTAITQSPPGTSITAQQPSYSHNQVGKKGQQCPFCQQMIPARSRYVMETCPQCMSPLTLSHPPANLVSNAREATRFSQAEAVQFYTAWPSKPHVAKIENLSATGLKLKFPSPLAVGNIIKIENDKFQAVGRVQYQQYATTYSLYGIHFISCTFAKEHGNFINLSA